MFDPLNFSQFTIANTSFYNVPKPLYHNKIIINNRPDTNNKPVSNDLLLLYTLNSPCLSPPMPLWLHITSSTFIINDIIISSKLDCMLLTGDWNIAH